jgi:hypothetical protein
MLNTSTSAGSSAPVGLPTRPISGSTSSSSTSVAAVVSPSSFGIPPLVDPHNGMDQLVPESFHGALGVSEKY